MAGIELAIIDATTDLREFRQDLRTNEIYYHLAPGLGHDMNSTGTSAKNAARRTSCCPHHRPRRHDLRQRERASTAQQGVFAIKPSGVDFPQLTPEDMVIVDLEGNKVEGSYAAFVGHADTHRRLFLAFREYSRRRAHALALRRAFAQAGRGIPCFGTTHADYFYGEVPVTRPMTAEEIKGRYEWETGNVIVERFEKIEPDEVPARAGLQPRAVRLGAERQAKAVETAFALEIVAEMALKPALNPGLGPIPQALLDKHFLRKHGAGKYYGQTK